jgi:hypothetical protein
LIVSLIPKEKVRRRRDPDQESRNLLVLYFERRSRSQKNIGDAGTAFMAYFELRDTTNKDMGAVDNCISQLNVKPSEVVVNKDQLQRVGQV